MVMVMVMLNSRKRSKSKSPPKAFDPAAVTNTLKAVSMLNALGNGYVPIKSIDI
jgi:hypothetical protein